MPTWAKVTQAIRRSKGPALERTWLFNMASSMLSEEVSVSSRTKLLVIVGCILALAGAGACTSSSDRDERDDLNPQPLPPTDPDGPKSGAPNDPGSSSSGGGDAADGGADAPEGG